MVTAQTLATEIVKREGGYVNDPDDPGGPTKYGVTLGTLRRLGLDKNNDGRVNIADVKALTFDDAVQIFLKHYYHRPNINQLPKALSPSVFDMYVNAGGNAVKILQRLLAKFGEPVGVDGQIGPQTLAAVERCFAKAPAHLSDAYGIERRNYYYGLGDRRPSLRKFARTRKGGKGGWIKRAEEFIASKYHLSEQEHKERIATWG